MRKSLLIMALFGLAAGGSTACATKGFVRTQVAQVNEKVDNLNQSLEETQERTRQNESKINDVDQRAQTGVGEAKNAATAADQRASAAGDSATAAAAHAEALDKASKRMVYEVVLSENQGNFKFNKTELPDEAKAAIDDMVKQLMADPKGAYFEIEGHTDNVGPKTINEKLGLERAEAVKRYLYRAVPDSAAPHQRDQLRRGQAARPEQHARGPRAEPRRGHPRARLARSFVPRTSLHTGRGGGHLAMSTAAPHVRAPAAGPAPSPSGHRRASGQPSIDGR